MEKFFELYTAAFLSLNPAQVSEFYSYPVTFFTESGDSVILDKSSFSENTKKLLSIYTELGVSEIEFEILSSEKTNDFFEQVSIKWSFINAKGVDIYSSTTRYLIQIEQRKIHSVTTVNEMAKINALLKK